MKARTPTGREGGETTNRKRLLTAAVGALLALAIAGGVAYATIPGDGNVYTACMVKSTGTIRLIDKSLPSTNLMSHCTDKETEISWNQAGQPGPPGPQGAKGDRGAPGTNGTNGTDGKDVTSAPEAPGTNCSAGGVRLTAVTGVSYVCNGKDGTPAQGGVTILFESYNAATNLVTISGEGFGNSPTVVLAGTTLLLDTYNPSTGTIVAAVPGVLGPGNYRLEVQDGQGGSGEFVFTVS